MIHYQLQCSRAHGFDGWFKDSAGFDKLAKLGLIECPECGDKAITRALMAPAVATRRAAPPVQPVSPAASSAASSHATEVPSAPAGPPAQIAVSGDAPGRPMPDQVRAMLQRMRSEIEKTCDYVGGAFAEEARRMHRGESDKRSIYGETTAEQADALTEEGITFSRIPWIPRAEG